MKLALVAAFALVAAPAFAKGGTPKNHHCVGADGSEMAGVTKKACKKAGGKWEKMSKTSGAASSAGAADAGEAPATPK